MKNDQLLLDQFLLSHPEIALSSIEEFPTEEISQLIETLTPEQGQTIISQMIPFTSAKVLEKIPPEHAIRVVDLMPLPRAESVLRVCEKAFCESVLSGLQIEKVKYLSKALSFEKDQVGAHLEPDVLTLQEHLTAEKALTLIKESNAIIKSHIFITKNNNKLVGYLELTQLIQGNPDENIKSFVKPIPRTVLAEMNAKELLDHWDDAFVDLPVVNTDEIFLGTVSRTSLSGFVEIQTGYDKSILRTGNALGELYAIGLTGMLGGAESKS